MATSNIEISNEAELEKVKPTINTINNDIEDLSKFKLEKILHNNSSRKTICLQGQFEGSEEAGIIILEKTAFEDDKVKENTEFFSCSSTLKKLFHNDVYGNYECFPTAELNCKFPFLLYLFHVKN